MRKTQVPVHVQELMRLIRGTDKRTQAAAESVSPGSLTEQASRSPKRSANLKSYRNPRLQTNAQSQFKQITEVPQGYDCSICS